MTGLVDTEGGRDLFGAVAFDDDFPGFCGAKLDDQFSHVAGSTSSTSPTYLAVANANPKPLI